MSEFQSFELKFWRKRHGLSQGKFAKLSGLGLNTIMKIEAGLHQVQERTLIKLNQAVRDYEASLQKEALSTDSNIDTPPAVSAPASSVIEEAEPSEIPVRVASSQIVLSNLDLELISRILTLTPIEKVNLLKSMIE